MTRELNASGRHRPGSRRIVLAAGATAILGGASVWWWQIGGRGSGAGIGIRAALGWQEPLNLLLVTLDTTRADRLGAYGYAGIQTPVIDRLAAEGILFERAITATPLTLPAHTSIMTGLYPPRHGVRDNGGFIVRDETVMLAERLGEQGYRTGAFVGAYVLDRRWGLNQGFATYADDFDLSKVELPSLATVERPGNEVADRALAWLGDAAFRGPFFAWVHFYDPHSPYRAPEPYGRVYARQPYLGEIAFADMQVGRLVAFLEQRRLLDHTIVVVVGDHGESLGEHGEGTHGFFLYEATTRVPLIIRAPQPAMQPRRVTSIVRTVDLVPTLLELLAQPLPDRIDGRSVVPLMTGAVRDLGLDAYSEAFYPRFHFGWSELLALHSGGVKYIAAPRPEVYDLVADPGESRNLFEQRRDESERVVAAMRAHEKGAAPVPSGLDAEARRRLAALGYLASSASAPPAAADGLADPKDKVDLFNLMTRAQELTQRRDRDDSATEIVGILRQVIARDRHVVDAWLMLGNELSRQHDAAGAAEQFRQALALNPDYDLAVIGLARAYRALGRPQDAVLGYQQFLGRDPSNAQVRFELAQTLLDADDLDAAEPELQRVLQREPSMAQAQHALGALRLKRGQVAEAEKDIRAALVAKPDIRMAHFHLALIAEGRGQFDAAADEYRQEIQHFPENHIAHFNLGKLFERRGDTDSQMGAFRKAIEVNPEFAEGHLFLAKLLLDIGRDQDEAVRLARRGIEMAPRGEYAALGHYLIAEALTRQGRNAEALQEVERGKALETKTQRRSSPSPR